MFLSCHEDLFDIRFDDNKKHSHAQRIIYELVTTFVRAYTGRNKPSQDTYTTISEADENYSTTFAVEMDQLFFFIQKREVELLENPQSGDEFWEHFKGSWKHMTKLIQECCECMSNFIRHGLVAFRELHSCLEDEEEMTKEIAKAVANVTSALRKRGEMYKFLGGSPINNFNLEFPTRR